MATPVAGCRDVTIPHSVRKSQRGAGLAPIGGQRGDECLVHRHGPVLVRLGSHDDQEGLFSVHMLPTEGQDLRMLENASNPSSTALR